MFASSTECEIWALKEAMQKYDAIRLVIKDNNLRTISPDLLGISATAL
jgi:hypothetical protein